ncbi:uncharacterized protein involved in type VI secretion and phage assembly [Pseudomonas lini]|nr:uncharacterized protein involved in type VI secretion and phage assembly [Pseudomonas lini]
MPSQLRTFFDHSRHKLRVHNFNAPLDVLAFHGEEQLSQPFHYVIEFTCTEQDIAADQLLNREARFSLHAPPRQLTFLTRDLPIKPLRTLHGVVTGFKRLSGSVDEARYEITLQPRLALLARGQQFRIYQHQSVPEIVEQILRSRHDFRGEDFFFKLTRTYPKRLQVMQYGESDLAFIARLLAEVGIWYRFTSDERLHLDVVEFHDDQLHYQSGIELPCHPPAGLSSSEQDGVWALQTRHQVVERQVNIRTYQHRDARAHLDGEIDHTRGASPPARSSPTSAPAPPAMPASKPTSRPFPIRKACVFARHCSPSRRSPAPSRPGSATRKNTTPTPKSTSKGATACTSCSTATPGNPARKACGCAWPGPTPATPTACICR